MKNRIHRQNDCLDQSENDFKQKNDSLYEDGEEYFPLEDSTPPHY